MARLNCYSSQRQIYSHNLKIKISSEYLKGSYPELGWCHPGFLFEFSTKTGGIQISYGDTDFINRHFRCMQQFFGLFQAKHPQVIGKIDIYKTIVLKERGFKT